jgi:nucleotide-binding universal stress UspA family protein
VSPKAGEQWIVGHDGSAGAATAASWALAQADGRHLDVDICRAWQISAFESPMDIESLARFAPAAVCDDLNELVTVGATAGAKVTGSIVQGGAAHVLLDASEHAALLVVGSRGIGGFRRLLLGSVSSQCATHSRVPIVVVPAASTVDRPVERVTVGVDGSDGSLRALEWAMNFRSDRTSIRVVSAWKESKSGYVEVAQITAHEMQRTRERFNDLLDTIEAADGHSVRFDRHFVHASPARTRLADSVKTDLVVVGARGNSGLSAAVLGSVSTDLIHHSKAPVVVVPTAADH